MAHALALGGQIAFVVGVGGNLDGHILNNLQSVGFQPHPLHRIVGDETHLVDTQMAEHLCPAAVVALIGLEPEVDIGIHRVVSS